MQEESDSDRLPLGVKDLPSSKLFYFSPPEHLYHYTSTHGIYGILNSKTLWLSKVQQLNDKSELISAIKEFINFCNTAHHVHPNDKLFKFVIAAANNLTNFSSTNICVASFCEDKDLLSQWRGYAQQGGGFAIGFSGNHLKALCESKNFALVKCLYAKKEHQLVFKDLLNTLTDCYNIIVRKSPENILESNLNDLKGYFISLFLEVAPVLKNETFSEEKEWRIITHPISIKDNNFKVKTTPKLREFYELSFNEVPYRQMITNVTIGPGNDFDTTVSAISTMLNKNLYENWSISPSRIPLRLY